MKVHDLRQLSVEELKGKVREWADEKFRSRFKAQTAEAKDTSVLRKLRRDIARAKTILSEKLRAQGSSSDVGA